MPAFCSRYLEDGLIWQPEPALGEGDAGLKNWSVKHFATFSALGYVQAGKEQRKFTVSPSGELQDDSYTTVLIVQPVRKSNSACSPLQIFHTPPSAMQ